MLTEQDFINASDLLKCEPAAIKAVAEVEGKGKGFFNDGSLIMLFEPHIFWKRLKVHGLKPENYKKGNEDILYIKQGERPYPGSSKARYEQLNRAIKIHELAAYESCSWGMFQIMGFNASLAGFKNALEMAESFKASLSNHLKGFCKYIISTGLDDELRFRLWQQFARAYNGELYFKFKYDSKMEAAYWKYKR